MRLCLDSLTLNDVEPTQLIRSAKVAGFDCVSLWVQPPPIFAHALVTPAKVAACKAALADTGMQVHALEAFDLSSASAVESYRAALELGARLGAQSASAINLGNPDATQVSDLLAQFAETAAEYGLRATFEPLSYFATSTLAQAQRIIKSSGANVGLVLDLTHLVRAGGTAADVRAVEPGLIRYVQLCDGPQTMSAEEAPLEAPFNRLYPGEGAFPLVELLRDVSMDIEWGIEAPSRVRVARGESPDHQACEAMAAMRRLIDQVLATKGLAQSSRISEPAVRK